MDDRTAFLFPSAPTPLRRTLAPLAAALLLGLVLGLSACSSSGDAPPEAPAAEETATTESEPVPDDASAAPAVEAAAEPAPAGNAAMAEGDSAAPADAATPAAPSAAMASQPEPAQAMAMAPAPGALNVPAVPAPVMVQRQRGEKRTPFDEAFPTTLHEPTVRIAVLSGPDKVQRGQEVATMLTEQEKDALEQQLGMAVKIAYVSQRREPIEATTAIHYREGFFKAAVRLAGTLPGDQRVVRMSSEEELRIGMDVIIYLSDSYN